MVAQIDKSFLTARPAKLWPRMLAYTLFEGRPLTTRGRWINPLVFLGFRLWNTLPLKMPAPDPVFILGTGRSGTTVLGTILALHPEVGYLNEPKALWQSALGDDDLIGSYSRTPGRYRMGARDATPDAVRRLRRSYAAYLRLSGCRRVVDKYPELLFRAGLVNKAFPQARKIMLVRNGLDTLRSIEAWSARNGTQGDAPVDWWGRDRQKWHLLLDQVLTRDAYFAIALPVIRHLADQRNMAAVEWIATMREALRLRARGDEIHFVHYEDLVARPRETLQKTLAFCGLAPDEKLLSYGERTLRPRAPHDGVTLHPAIAPLFRETMASLGYDWKNAA